MRALRPIRQPKEWRSQSGQPLPSEPLGWRIAYYSLYLVGIGGAGFFAQTTAVGFILLGLYAAAALLLRIPSYVTFRVALLGFVAVPALKLAGQDDLAGVYAQYIFLLLCIGTITALAHHWRLPRPRFFEAGLFVHAKVDAVGGRPAILGNAYTMQEHTT